MSVADIDDDDDKWHSSLRGAGQQKTGEALVKAARTGNAWRVEKLLDMGADINFREGRALLAAVSQKHHRIAELLIARGIDLKPVKNDALCEAAAQADAVMVRRFLELGADANAEEASALSLAIPRGNADVIRLLLSAGADVTARNGHFLHIAIAHGHAEAALLMLAHGADPEIYYRDMNALDWSVEIGLREVSEAIRSGNTGIVMTADYFSGKPPAELLAESPLYPGHTGLHLAAKAGHFDVIRDKFLADPQVRLQASDLTRETLAGESVLLLLGKAGRLDAAFDPRLWSGRREEMLALHQKHVPPAFQAQVDIAAAAAAVERLSLRKDAPRLTLRPRRPGV